MSEPEGYYLYRVPVHVEVDIVFPLPAEDSGITRDTLRESAEAFVRDNLTEALAANLRQLSSGGFREGAIEPRFLGPYIMPHADKRRIIEAG